jgi:hypothetical protein
MAQQAWHPFYFTDFIIPIEIGFATSKLAGFRFASRLDCVSFVWIPHPQNHCNAPLGEAPANGKPNAPVATGHQCYAFFMFRHIHPPNDRFILYKIQTVIR